MTSDTEEVLTRAPWRPAWRHLHLPPTTIANRQYRQVRRFVFEPRAKPREACFERIKDGNVRIVTALIPAGRQGYHRPQSDVMPMSDIADLLKQAVLAFASLSDEQKRAHMAAQSKSWVIREIMSEHPQLSRAEAERIYHQVVL